MARKRGFGETREYHAASVADLRERAQDQLNLARRELARNQCYAARYSLMTALQLHGVAKRERVHGVGGVDESSARDDFADSDFMLGVDAAMTDMVSCECRSRGKAARAVRRYRRTHSEDS